MADKTKKNTPSLPESDPKVREAVEGKTEDVLTGNILEQRRDVIDLHGSLGNVMEEMAQSFETDAGISRADQKTAVQGKLEAGANAAIDLFEGFHAAFAAIHTLIGEGKAVTPYQCTEVLFRKLSSAGGPAKAIADSQECKKEINAALSGNEWSGEKLRPALVKALGSEQSADIAIAQLGALHPTYKLVLQKEGNELLNATDLKNRKDLIKFMSGTAAAKDSITGSRRMKSAQELNDYLMQNGLIENGSVTEVVIDFQRVCFVRPNDAKAKQTADTLLVRTYGFGVTEVVKRSAFMTKEQMKLCKTVRVRAKNGTEAVLGVVKDGKTGGRIGLSKAAKDLGITKETTHEGHKAMFDFCVPETFGVSEDEDQE